MNTLKLNKQATLVAIMAIAIFLSSSTVFAQGRGGGNGEQGGQNGQGGGSGQGAYQANQAITTGGYHKDVEGREKGLIELVNGPKYEITESDIDALEHMREEEKIARDVYIALYEKWNNKTFDNISKSEEKHMEAVKTLMDKYGIADSVVSNEVGVFGTKEFQDLYNALVANGYASELEALQVGATIEDLDIYDLERFMKLTSNKDILKVFTNLNNASTNHLRSFNRQVESLGGTYSAQYITDERLQKILSAQDAHGGNQNSGQQRSGRQNNNQYQDTNYVIETQVSQRQGFLARLFNFFAFWR